MNSSRESSNLDFLRSVAVMLVLANHLVMFYAPKSSWLFSLRKIGLVGVLFFFVHTSLVLMLSLERQEAKTGRARLFRKFMVRRFFRIYPLSLLVVSLIFLLGIPSAGVGYHVFSSVSLSAFGLIANLGLFQNIFYIDPITGPLWSLPYEMQMYLFLPAIYLVAQRMTSRKALLAFWLVGLGIAVFPWPLDRLRDAVQYVPCFLPGIIAYRLLPRTRPSWPFWIFPILLMALVSWYVMGFLLEWDRIFTDFAMCLTLGLTLPHFIEVKSQSVRLVSQLIARYSYGIYLVHFPLMWFAFIYLAGTPALVRWAVFVVGMAGIPALLYHALEAPMIRVGNRVVERLFGPGRQPIPAPERVQDPVPLP